MNRNPAFFTYHLLQSSKPNLFSLFRGVKKDPRIVVSLWNLFHVYIYLCLSFTLFLSFPQRRIEVGIGLLVFGLLFERVEMTVGVHDWTDILYQSCVVHQRGVRGNKRKSMGRVATATFTDVGCFQHVGDPKKKIKTRGRPLLIDPSVPTRMGHGRNGWIEEVTMDSRTRERIQSCPSLVQFQKLIQNRNKRRRIMDQNTQKIHRSTGTKNTRRYWRRIHQGKEKRSIPAPQ